LASWAGCVAERRPRSFWSILCEGISARGKSVPIISPGSQPKVIAASAAVWLDAPFAEGELAVGENPIGSFPRLVNVRGVDSAENSLGTSRMRNDEPSQFALCFLRGRG
jgi:hypothetical protein